ncbi:hypothetical protein J3F84DRAFT_368217 [Trichoderma pleuroticola]
MAPRVSFTGLSLGIIRSTQDAQTTANDFRDQWTNPSDIFSLLLLVGGDVIQKALAQFTLNRFRPMAFSFGWVAYAFSHLLFAVGNLKALRVEATGGSQNLRIAAASVQLVFWVALLITVSGLKTHTWFMVAVGALGMMQNLVLAGAPRTPEALGIPVQLEQVVGLPRVMDTLLELEAKVPYAGKALLPIYIPGRLRESEIERWEALESEHERAGNF